MTPFDYRKRSTLLKPSNAEAGSQSCQGINACKVTWPKIQLPHYYRGEIIRNISPCNNIITVDSVQIDPWTNWTNIAIEIRCNSSSNQHNSAQSQQPSQGQICTYQTIVHNNNQRLEGVGKMKIWTHSSELLFTYRQQQSLVANITRVHIT